jgi:AcrR family transcriptional regulator
MADEELVAGTAPKRGAASRRELAVARVLEPARERAEGKVKAFIDAALELISSDSGQDFTVQEVIERSGESLRSFYQHFNGKYELLLALFEDAVHFATVQLHAALDGVDDPIERMHVFAIEYYRICQPPPRARAQKKGFAPAFASFAQQLLTEHSQEASHAFAPMTEILVGLLDGAAASGAIRRDIDCNRTAGVVLQAIMFNAFAATISGVPVQPTDGDPAEQLWDVFLHGLAAR